ncbi:hypothetical protein B296_00033195, partial [Ensete ventricosum]
SGWRQKDMRQRRMVLKHGKQGKKDHATRHKGLDPCFPKQERVKLSKASVIRASIGVHENKSSPFSWE